MTRAGSPLRDQMIFVVGARRSGTNWLQRVVGAHPDVLPLPSETSLFSHGLAPLADRFHHGPASSSVTGTVYMDRDLMLEALRDLCDSVFTGLREGIGSRAGRILERTPDHVRHLDLMGAIYPDGWFLHIVRDGRDVARSLLSQPWGPQTIAEAAEEWSSAIKSARSAAAHLERYREIRYEDLLDDPGARIPELFSWLGLEHTEDLVDAALGEAGARFNVDPAAPEVTSQKWRHSLSSDDLEAFERVAGSTLRDLSYDVAPHHGSDRESERDRRPRRRTRRRRRKAQNIEERLRESNHLNHQLVDIIGRRGWDDLPRLVRGNVHVTIVEDTAWSGRGTAALEQLAQTLAEDTALRGHQVRGDVVPSAPTTLAVLTFRTPDGRRHDRLVATTAESGKISRVAYYRLGSFDPGNVHGTPR